MTSIGGDVTAATTHGVDPGVTLDGLQMAVLKNRLETVARAMTNTLLRTGRSGVLNVARDFSCCILTGEDELLAIAESIPVHVLSGPDLMARTMKEFHPDLRRGDAFLHNSPYHGNSHAADWSILVPVVDDEGIHRFTVLAKAHQADCGNCIPTTYAVVARDVYEEGALIFPAVLAQREYEPNGDLMRMFEQRIRAPEQCVGDYLALLGAARVGEMRMLELIDDYGAETLDAFAAQWFDHSEQRMVNAIRKVPGGTYTVDAFHDPMPGVPDGVHLTISVNVKSQEAMIEIDLTDNPDCVPCGLNLSEACARSAALLGTFNSIGGSVPSNAGSFRRVRVHLRKNCCVGIPSHPVSCSAATTDLMDRVANATMRCFAEAGEGFGMAEFGYCIGAGSSVLSGCDPRTGRNFVNQVFLGYTGGAASPRSDGWLTSFCVGAAGMLMHDSVEIDEIKHPIRIVEQRIVPDSEGAGRFRGAPSALVELGPVGCGLEVIYTADGTHSPPRGVRGGASGSGARQYVRRADGSLEELPNTSRLELSDGERLLAYGCAGGGYGVPSSRDPERVARDVREGWITPARAAEIYGVSVTPEGEIDAIATEALRSRR
jgi:N-methylhydantoinase B